jgi:hypothetical protein
MAVNLPPPGLKRPIRSTGFEAGSIDDQRLVVEGLDSIFYCTAQKPNEVIDYIECSKILKWNRDESSGSVVLPKEYRLVQVYAKYNLEYPMVIYRGTLPAINTMPGDENFLNIWFGVENGKAGGNMLIGIYRRRFKDGTVTHKAAWYKMLLYPVWFGETFIDSYVSSPEVNKHVYSIEVHENLALFKINGVIRTVFIPSAVDTSIIIESRPYNIMIIDSIPKNAPAFLEFGGDRKTPASADVVENFTLFGFRASSGNRIANMNLPLYITGTDTKIAGQTVGTSGVTSHWFPTLGYRDVVVHFMAGASGTLYADLYTIDGIINGVRTVSVSANVYTKIVLDERALMARVRFVPSVSTTVSVASVSLSG